MKKISVITGSRAEYGLLRGLMQAIKNEPDLELQVIATGTHLSPEFGLTYKNILNDGFSISAKVESLLAGNSPTAVAKSMGLGTVGFADAFAVLNPDFVIFLGDRFEILAAAQAAMVAGIPMGHIHGGEVTEGAIDESIRHALTKMSHLHFVASEPYRKRVIQLGEQPSRVFNFGAIGVDSILKREFLTRKEFENKAQFSFGPQNFLITYHPETLSKQNPLIGLDHLLNALNSFPTAHLIISMANADVGGSVINERLQNYAQEKPSQRFFYKNLGHALYIDAVHLCDVVIGNSSSGIVEAPYLRKPTINIGRRQAGRTRADSVIDCTANKVEIEQAIHLALSAPFQEKIIQMELPYGTGGVANKIVKVLKETQLNNLLTKTFYDL